MTNRTVRPVASLLLAGACFAAYPVLRGYGDESGLRGAELFARDAWLLAHLMGMAGFVLVAYGLRVVDAFAHRWAMVGAFLVLPYYGAEAFGLHALGQRIVETGHSDMTEVADMFRYDAVAITMFALGWAAWSAVGVRLLVLLRQGVGGRRVGLALTGLALVTYLPQFFLAPAGRITHGLVLAAGLVMLAGAVATRDSGVPDRVRDASSRASDGTVQATARRAG
jgi:hypothetical protein